VTGELPELPFGTGRFDLVLCSHLLFTWVDRFNLSWHVEALRELLRVCAGEIRVFPLVAQETGRPVEILPEVLERLNVRWEIREVPYELQRGANQTLVLRNHG
jgi:SAM-dependent methyltransferase